MKILMIGGTGTISSAITKELLRRKSATVVNTVDPISDCEVYLCNRGSRNNCLPEGYKEIHCDINNEEEAKEAFKDLSFDVVCEFIAFVPAQLERDYRIFNGKTKQFIFISSASAYQKPVGNYKITESTPLCNPYWEYSRNKIACEEYLLSMYRETGFPVTIVRPSHTYDERSIPLGVHGAKGSYSVIKRILEEKPVIIHGDGTSLWTITHNSDFARAFIGLMGNDHAIGEAVQITSDESVTWNQIYAAISEALHKPLHAVHVSSEFLAACGDDPYDFTGSLLGDKSNTVVFDNTKLKSLVPGFTATVSAKAGIKHTVDYVLSHKECQIEDPDFDKFCDAIISARENAIKMIKN